MNNGCAAVQWVGSAGATESPKIRQAVLKVIAFRTDSHKHMSYICLSEHKGGGGDQAMQRLAKRVTEPLERVRGQEPTGGSAVSRRRGWRIAGAAGRRPGAAIRQYSIYFLRDHRPIHRKQTSHARCRV